LAAFFDLYKLEQYVRSGNETAGLSLWLTNKPDYLKQATGKSQDFGTHPGRRYVAGTALRATRSRNRMPLPLALGGSYTFAWQEAAPQSGWYSLVIEVGPHALPNQEGKKLSINPSA
jgi:hypothetical protein